MATIGEVLVDAFGRVLEEAKGAVDGLSVEALTHRPDGTGNSIAWLVWHLTRVQDDHVADAFGTDQVWLAQEWVRRFALPFDDAATGYGHTSEEVDQVTASADLLTGYLTAVTERTVELVRGVSATDLDRIVDTRWDPPVTLAVRLVSVLGDDHQHAGQAAYVRGLLG